MEKKLSTISDEISRSSLKYLNNIALVEETKEITYEELDKNSNRLANYLIEMGITKGSIVGILMNRSIELITAMLGIIKSGAAYLAINPDYPEKRIIKMLEDSNSNLIICKERYIKSFSYTNLQGLNNKDLAIIETNVREQIKDFDSIPFPDRSLVDYNEFFKYINLASVQNSITMQGTRGCPYHCVYCHKIWPKKHVVRSAENLFEEVLLNYKIGVRKFSMIDDIFNFDIKNSSRFLNLIIENRLNDIQLFFPNGVRGDILTKEYIDLMVKAGMRGIGFALETGSPRLQKLIKKNMDLNKLRNNINYVTTKYPHIVVDLFTMHGFPTETEEEAMMTLDFIKSIKWIDFPYIFILKIYPGTDMEKLALDNGIKKEDIEQSMNLMYHELPYTLPFSKGFTQKYQADFLNEYFLSKERLRAVLPREMELYTEEEFVQRYNSYLPVHISKFEELLELSNLDKEEFSQYSFLEESYGKVENFREKAVNAFPQITPCLDAFRMLFIDLSQDFSVDSKDIILQVEAPLGHMYLLTYLKKVYDEKINGKILKAGIDFDNYHELKKIVEDFNPDAIGIRTLTYWKDFFHTTVSKLRQWGFKIPIITGGPYATSSYESILNDKNVDIVIRGEGELTLAELIGKMMEHENKLPSLNILKDIDGIVFQDKNLNKKRKNTRNIISLEDIDLNMYSSNSPRIKYKETDILYVIYTSGTTGAPKGILMMHKNLSNLINDEFIKGDLNFKGKVLQFADMCFDISYQEIFSTLIAGGKLYLVPDSYKSNVIKLFEYIEHNDIETVFLPTAYLNIIMSNKKYINAFPKCIRNLIVAGETLRINQAFLEFLKQSKLVLHNHYGVSETHVVTTYQIDANNAECDPPIGKEIEGVNIYILDENRKETNSEEGEIYVAGEAVGRGYINNQEETEKYFVPDINNENKIMYRTGDRGKRRADGNIIFLGRKDRQVKIRGFRVELEEIENVLKHMESVTDAVVISENNEEAGTKIYAYVSSDTLTEERLMNEIKNTLPDYMIPDYVMLLNQLPIALNGKIDFDALSAMHNSPIHKIEVIKEDFTETEEKLITFCKDILNCKYFSKNADFFEYGGDSISCTQLLSLIYLEYGVEIELSEFFSNPTITALASLIESYV